MIPGIVEYVALRLVRRFMFSEKLLDKVGGFLPYYRMNANQSDPRPVVDAYASALARIGRNILADANILEIGSGATNSVGYEMLRRGFAGGQGHVYMYEPGIALDKRLDERMARTTVPPDAARRIRRLTSLEALAPGSVDVALSNSVLEHVTDMDALLRELRVRLSPQGVMIHVVDYRDHFFKYPYHFLLFEEATWQRWLDPGNLPRWRLNEHLEFFRKHGFATEVLMREDSACEFGKVREFITGRFDRDDPMTAVTGAVVAVSRQQPH